ncbi:taste receptor type 1 member 2-like [Xiphophorus couchianus]|uniref:taste receptor type 1 member 2-like n=1 Tax=Xiphophorus couchianus TaxID=32473 RepID=UPI00101704C1|nr:taste receptor type 1 member 2-like [Xiphophorus couchianus]
MNVALPHFSVPSQPFILSSYRRFQLMRFAIEEINNSTKLLPNVPLGYKILDLCSDTQNFPGVFNLISDESLIQPWNDSQRLTSKMVTVVGSYTSTGTLSVAPLFMMDFFPMVSYGAASSVFSRKNNFPSFLRTVHPNKDVIEVVLRILREFNWRWVSFLHIDDDYGRDGRDLFIRTLEHTEFCLAYTKALDHDTDYYEVFQQITLLEVNVLIVFAPEWTAEDLVEAAIKYDVTNKVWIAGDAWSLHKELPKRNGIRKIGTVVGIAEPKMAIPGFNAFINAFRAQTQEEDGTEEKFCSQACNCSIHTVADIIDADPSFNFPVYSAVYSVAHALHTVLQCETGRCNRRITGIPHMILQELWKTNFTLLNQSVQFDENGDPSFGSYAIVFWNKSGEPEEVGLYSYHSSLPFIINRTKIQWHGNGSVPQSICSEECDAGFAKKQEGLYKCCFSCTKCESGTYINSTADPYTCHKCDNTEWSEAGSTSCYRRQEDYMPLSHDGAVVVMLGALIFMGLCAAVSVLFFINYKTPVVKFAGGPMCFLILGCLALSSLSVFFAFGEPTTASCVLRVLPVIFFSTVCLACFAVRSFQIVCIFKIAARFPNIPSWWMKYKGQWLVICVACISQAVLLIIGLTVFTPHPQIDTERHSDIIIQRCGRNFNEVFGSLILILLLIILSFCFSYCGKDLPKNYNEAKSITFCLLLLIIIWIIYATVYTLYRGKYIHFIYGMAVLSSLYSFLSWYFLPKCCIIIFQPQKNTQQYFQCLIQSYTKIVNQ